MKRSGDDVFHPETTTRTDASSTIAEPELIAGLASNEVIELLEPLAKDERVERLKGVLDERKKSVTVVLDNPHDPHNGSAVMRSCDAFGIAQVHVLSEHEKFAASKMVAKGAQRWLDIVEHEDPGDLAEHLKAQGYQLYVTHPEGEANLETVRDVEKIAFIMGNERDGVSEELSRLADGRVRIEMCGFVESLNVSVSAAILIQAAASGREGDLSQQEKEYLYAQWLSQSVPRADEILAAHARKTGKRSSRISDRAQKAESLPI